MNPKHAESRNKATNLVGQYSEIGVAVVAASIRYQGERRNLEHSPNRTCTNEKREPDPPETD